MLNFVTLQIFRIIVTNLFGNLNPWITGKLRQAFYGYLRRSFLFKLGQDLPKSSPHSGLVTKKSVYKWAPILKWAVLYIFLFTLDFLKLLTANNLPLTGIEPRSSFLRLYHNNCPLPVLSFFFKDKETNLLQQHEAKLLNFT